MRKLEDGGEEKSVLPEDERAAVNALALAWDLPVLTQTDPNYLRPGGSHLQPPPTIYEIKFLESVIVTTRATGAAAEAKLDDTIPVAPSHPSTPWDIPGPPTAPEADLLPDIPATQPPTRGAEARWLQEGAKPKVPLGYFTLNPKLCNSTPGPWIPVKSNTRLKKKSPPRHHSVGILLSNSFSPLVERDFPLLPTPERQAPPLLPRQTGAPRCMHSSAPFTAAAFR
ncbi:-hydroxytryptamine receptor 2A [Xyrichtys novacula]|uniref:-hydroxytryptamine receptor 2A n=1 Tax=Xyrichtys novacula TaxID=13765 RepID=A0AAV1H747_XYRNO|nr:-hydroxytryptamine receptor 2A [Xyrichtys novacula]